MANDKTAAGEWLKIHKSIVTNKLAEAMLKGFLAHNSEVQKQVIYLILMASTGIGLVLANSSNIEFMISAKSIGWVLKCFLFSIIVGLFAKIASFYCDFFYKLQINSTSEMLSIIESSNQETEAFEDKAGIKLNYEISFKESLKSVFSMVPKFLMGERINKSYEAAGTDQNYNLKVALNSYFIATTLLLVQFVLFLVGLFVAI